MIILDWRYFCRRYLFDAYAIDFCNEVIDRMIRSAQDALTEDRFWKHYTYVDGQLVKRGSFEEKKLAESKLEE